jgi:hypothetical protein
MELYHPTSVAIKTSNLFWLAALVGPFLALPIPFPPLIIVIYVFGFIPAAISGGIFGLLYHPRRFTKTRLSRSLAGAISGLLGSSLFLITMVLDVAIRADNPIPLTAYNNGVFTTVSLDIFLPNNICKISLIASDSRGQLTLP